MASSGIVAASITSKVSEALLLNSGKDLKTLQTGLVKENPHAESGFAIPNLTVHIAAAVEHIRKDDRNVLAMTQPSAQATEYVLVGAHYDHLGFGETGAMLRAGEGGHIHPAP